MLTLENIKEQLEQMGYEVTIDWFGYMEIRFQIIIFQEDISVDRVRVSLTRRGWIPIKEYKGNYKRYILEKAMNIIELQDLPLSSHTTIHLRENYYDSENRK